MKRSWVLLIAAAAVAGVLFQAGPSCLAGGGEPSQEAKNKDEVLKNIQEQLKSISEKMNNRFDSLNGSLAKSFEKVQEDMAGVKKTIQTLKDEVNVQRDLNSLALKRIADLEETVSKLAAEMGALKAKSNVTLYPPHTSKFPPSGTVKAVLVNNTAERVLFVVNGQSVPVPAFSTQEVPGQASGTFNYKVYSPTFGLLRDYTTELKAYDVYTITVG